MSLVPFLPLFLLLFIWTHLLQILHMEMTPWKERGFFDI